jgi:hypothetical protein
MGAMSGATQEGEKEARRGKHSETVMAEGKHFCVVRLDISLDTTATCEAVVMVMDKLVCISNVWFESISHSNSDRGSFLLIKLLKLSY